MTNQQERVAAVKRDVESLLEYVTSLDRPDVSEQEVLGAERLIQLLHSIAGRSKV